MNKEDTTKTPISEIGEFGLIEKISTIIPTPKKSIKGIGDDCAVIDSGKKYTLVSTDLLCEGIHFRLSYSPLKHLGYKAAMVNFSDIFAMNGNPKSIVVGISVSNKLSVESIEELYEGIVIACKKHDVEIIGGDTTSCISGMTISITVIGECEKENICYRKGAKKNDLVCVSGNLGAAYLGLLALEREYKVFKDHPNFSPNLEGKEFVLEKQLKPDARGDIITLLKEKNILPTAMIDISDGLSSEIRHLSKESSAGITIYEEKIPVHEKTYFAAQEMNLNAITCALHGGEDYELLFTLSQKEYEKIKDETAISIIGHVTEEAEECFFIPRNGSPIELPKNRYDSFQKNIE